MTDEGRTLADVRNWDMVTSTERLENRFPLAIVSSYTGTTTFKRRKRSAYKAAPRVRMGCESPTKGHTIFLLIDSRD